MGMQAILKAENARVNYTGIFSIALRINERT